MELRKEKPIAFRILFLIFVFIETQLKCLCFYTIIVEIALEFDHCFCSFFLLTNDVTKEMNESIEACNLV